MAHGKRDLSGGPITPNLVPSKEYRSRQKPASGQNAGHLSQAESNPPDSKLETREGSHTCPRSGTYFYKRVFINFLNLLLGGGSYNMIVGVLHEINEQGRSWL